MGNVESSIRLKLLVDKKKNKVVLAESGKEFVDVLFSLLTLPLGTIVRLLWKYQHDQKCQEAATIGCFNALYKSVFGLGTDNFLSDACKEMLLFPRSVKEKQCRRLKLNADDTNVLKYYRCSNTGCTWSCPQVYSNFCSSICSCGESMRQEFATLGVGCEEIFESDKNLFTVTDKMEVRFTSMGLTVKTLKELGYTTDADQLQEMVVLVNRETVLALLHCLFSSDTPLTDVFLRKRSSCNITVSSIPVQVRYAGTAVSTGVFFGNRSARVITLSSLPGKVRYAGTAEPHKVMSVTLFTRKLDKKVLYAECGKDFVDLLFTFLVLPLSSTYEMSGSNIVLGCIGNLCESFKGLSSSQGRRNTMIGKCTLPWYYSCHRPLLDVWYGARDSSVQLMVNYRNYLLEPMDPRCNKIGDPECSGFVKEGKTFMVLDDLTITPMNLSSNIFTLKKFTSDLNDIEEHVINITQTEAMGLLRASFLTSTALTTAFRSLLLKKPKEERL